MNIPNLQQKNGSSLIVNLKVNLTNSLESSLCDYSDVYILVRGNITATTNNAATQVVFKNCAPFEKCRTEINETFIDEADFINILICLCTI